jgi:hypothetical protein
MTSHAGWMIVFGACVALVFGALLREELREQIRLTLKIFGALVFGAYALGWLMFLAFR